MLHSAYLKHSTLLQKFRKVDRPKNPILQIVHLKCAFYVSVALRYTASLFCKAATAFNPFIYFFMSHGFRQDFIEVVYRCCIGSGGDFDSFKASVVRSAFFIIKYILRIDISINLMPHFQFAHRSTASLGGGYYQRQSQARGNSISKGSGGRNSREGSCHKRKPPGAINTND